MIRQYTLVGLAFFLTLNACKQRAQPNGASDKNISELGEPRLGLEAYTRKNFLRSLQGVFPPVGRAIGVVVTVKLSRWGYYDAGALGTIVSGLTSRISAQVKDNMPASYVVVAIDSSRVLAPASIVAKKIADEDVSRRTDAARSAGMSDREISEIIFFSEDRSSWYAGQYEISTDLAMTLIDRSGRKIESCAIPGKTEQCFATLDQFIVADAASQKAASEVAPEGGAQ